MKEWALVVAILSLAWPALAQTNTPNLVGAPPEAAAAPAEPAVEPPSATKPDNTRYLNDPPLLNDCQAQLALFDNKPCDMIFIGGTITSGWATTGKDIWDKYYGTRNALNFGVNGDKTQNVLWRINNMSVQNIHPKIAVILIGTNNIANTPREIADGVKLIVANTQSAFPGVNIILVSIMPNVRANDKMMDANSRLRHFADDTTVFYLDLVPLMPAVVTKGKDGKDDTNYKGLSKDHLLPDASGYQIWADAMEPIVTKILTPPAAQ